MRPPRTIFGDVNDEHLWSWVVKKAPDAPGSVWCMIFDAIRANWTLREVSIGRIELRRRHADEDVSYVLTIWHSDRRFISSDLQVLAPVSSTRNKSETAAVIAQPWPVQP